MNIRAKNGQPTTVKLIQAEHRYLESAQGICAVIARNMAGDRAGEAAMHAEENLATLRELLTAESPAKLTAK
jgi:hypothetical protein